MNKTCIYLRVEDSNIYMYKREYIKNLLEKYNNRKDVNTYLILIRSIIIQFEERVKSKTKYVNK
jgi:hypothetical protein